MNEYNEIQAIKDYCEGREDITPQTFKSRLKTSVPKYCNRCGNRVYTSELRDYTYQCLCCDEDLYNFEVTSYVPREEFVK